MKKLVDGYVKFKTEIYERHKHRFKALADQQKPHTLFITCSDSRVVPDLITQSEPGELFICRIIGNLVPAHGAMMGGVSAAVEYAVVVLGVEHIVVCGHSDCGAMRAFLHPEKLAPLKAVSAWLEHANMAITMANAHHSHLEGDNFVDRTILSGPLAPDANARRLCANVSSLGIFAIALFDPTIVDTEAPALSVTLSPAVLSPANNQMVPVTVTITVSDNADQSPTITLVSITSPSTSLGASPNGNRADIEGAAFGTDDRTFSLRADPAGKADRVYTVTYRATDAAGNIATASAQVVVRK